MRRRLICANDKCDNHCGWIYEYEWGYYGQDPPDVEPFNEGLVDSNGNCYCSEYCFEDETQPEGENQ